MDMHSECIELEPCREMAIDCPDGFIPEIKTRPSLPNLIANSSHFKSKHKSYKSLKKLSLSSNESSKSKNSSKNSDFSFTNLNTTNTPLLFSDNENLFQDRPPSYKSQNLYENDLLFYKDKQKEIEITKGNVNSAFNNSDEDTNKSDTLKSNSSNVRSSEKRKTLNDTDMKNLMLTCNNDLSLLNQILNSNEFLNKFNVRKSLVSKNLKDTLLNNETQVVKKSEQNIYENETILKSIENNQTTKKTERIFYSNTTIECTLNEKIQPINQNDDQKSQTDSLKKKSHDSKLLLDDLVLSRDKNDKIENEESLTDEGKYLLKKAQYYCVDNLKLVNIEKPDDVPLGATIKNLDGSIVISRIVMGSAAQKSGLLHENDEILEINMISVRGKTINDVCDMLCNLQGMISFLIIPNMTYEPVKVCVDEIVLKSQKIFHMRALFNYSPQEDLYIPCRELGLSFNKGDILHVTNQDDENWWQAYRDEDKDQSMAGLIPSQSFQEKRMSQMQAIIGDSFMTRKKRDKGFCVKNTRRKFLYGLDVKNDDIVTYEEVSLYKPTGGCKRPIVLIGPHNIGRHELRKRLMQANPSLFEVAVPHTTRPQRRDEVDGKDYHFLPRHIFEVDIKQGRFIEHGEYEKNLYGTSRESIKKVIDNSKICILNLYPQALKNLRASDLLPYVIYIGPPNLIKLKELKTNLDESFKESDLLDIIDRGREIEEMYGHYFDKIIRNCNMDKTYQELFDTINRVQNEENWVPKNWLPK